MGKLPSDWISHITDEKARKEFGEYVVRQTELFRVLRNIVQDRYNELAGTKPGDVRGFGWERERVYRDGQMNELEMLWKLIPTDEEDK